MVLDNLQLGKPIGAPLPDCGVPNFIDRATRAQSNLTYCALSFAELAHSVERAEWTIYIASSPTQASMTLKEFRHNDPTLRGEVVAEIQSA